MSAPGGLLAGPAVAMSPRPYRVTGRRVEGADTVSLVLDPVREPIGAPAAGQFTMVYAVGVGEVPLSVSDWHGPAAIVHTVRAVGAVTTAVWRAGPGTVLGLRGPYGTGWPLPAPPGADLLVVAGGIGLAPLRPVLRHVLAERDRYGQVVLLLGARSPAELLYPDEYEDWRAAGAQVQATVDRPDATWRGPVGVVTRLLDGLDLDPDRTAAYVCGPEVMMRLTAAEICRHGVAPGSVSVSLERNMKCGIGVCGHCQLGELLLCRDGPVVGYDRAEGLLETRQR